MVVIYAEISDKTLEDTRTARRILMKFGTCFIPMEFHIKWYFITGCRWSQGGIARKVEDGNVKDNKMWCGRILVNAECFDVFNKHTECAQKNLTLSK